MGTYQDLIDNAGMEQIFKPNAHVPVNQLVGFDQQPQDQYVDNRTTSAGSPIIDTRTPAEIGYDNTIQNQGLYDMSLDFAIPAGQAIGGILRGGAGLGLRGLEGMSNLRQGIQQGIGTGVLANEGRRQAIKVGATGIGGATVAMDPIANMAVKGLGASADNVLASTAPINIAGNIARENMARAAHSQIMMGSQHAGKYIPSITNAMNKMKTSVDDALLYEAKHNGKIVMRRGSDGLYKPAQIFDKKTNTMIDLERGRGPVTRRYGDGKLKTREGEVFIDPRTGKQVGTYGDEIQAGTMNSNYSGIADKHKEVLSAKKHLNKKQDQTTRIMHKADKNRKKALSSKDPVLSPKELNSEIARAKKSLASAEKKPLTTKEELYDDFGNLIGEGKTVPHTRNIVQVDKYKNRINNLEKQLETLTKTGKYSKINKNGPYAQPLPHPPKEFNMFK